MTKRNVTNAEMQERLFARLKASMETHGAPVGFMLPGIDELLSDDYLAQINNGDADPRTLPRSRFYRMWPGGREEMVTAFVSNLAMGNVYGQVGIRKLLEQAALSALDSQEAQRDSRLAVIEALGHTMHSGIDHAYAYKLNSVVGSLQNENYRNRAHGTLAESYQGFIKEVAGAYEDVHGLLGDVLLPGKTFIQYAGSVATIANGIALSPITTNEMPKPTSDLFIMTANLYTKAA